MVMAERGRTVRVSGLPADTEDEKLKDKLYIHFLRPKNGGGEIESVTIVKTPSVSALITFEDSGVAWRVIQQGWHILQMDGKKYKITVAEHRERLDPDKVILSLSATVNYSQLPGGTMALTSLHESHPDIQINYDTSDELCTLHATYSKLQAALAQLLGHSGGPQPKNKDSDQQATSGSTSIQNAQRPRSQESEDQSRKPNKQKEQRAKGHIGRPDDEPNSSSYRDLTPEGCGWEDTGQTEDAALQLPGHPTMSEEDFSLIVDADMFQYLQKHCQKEYQHILNQYGVDVVDLTNQGLTTLFLQVATGQGQEGRDQVQLKLARKAISRLYQENESKIRRAQLPKNILSPRGGLQRAMANLSVRHPKLLLNEDEKNIYIIGSSSDVSEAKQFLLLGHSQVRGKKEDVASLLRFPSYDSGSSAHASEQRVPLTMSSTLESLNDRLDQLLRPEEEEMRAEGAKRYKLAARFKDSRLGALGNRPTDISLQGLSSPSRQTRLGPTLGHDLFSETAEITGEGVSRALAQNTEGDILFKRGDALPSSASMQNKTLNSFNSHVTATRPKTLTSPLSPSQSSLSGSTSAPPGGSGSSLKRASSFSGTPQQKAQVIAQESQDDSGKSPVRARSSSFSNQAGRDKREIYAEITVSSVMWQYIKEAYSSRVEDLTSDVQVKESCLKGSSDLIVTIRGTNSATVSSCQLALQKLVHSVGVDFSLQELRLSELGITDRADENLKACCVEVHRRFKKVTIQVLKDSLFLLGPKGLCSQVGASLREVFSGASTQIPKQKDSLMPKSQTSKADSTGSQQRRTNPRNDPHETEFENGSISQPLVRRDPVIKEKVKIVGSEETDKQKAETFVNHSESESDRTASHANGVASTANRTDKDAALYKKDRATHSAQKDSTRQRQTEIQDTTEESRSGQGGLGICVCGEREKSMTRTECGATLCSKCLETLHVHCGLCHEAEPTPTPTPRGIQGRMNYSKLNISVPGHNKDSAIKITYCVPDGVQGKSHPSPGKPFRGGVFEAFLPDCEKTRELLPRLEKAFLRGLTFTVMNKETGARVAWDCIPHKTSLQGGKSGNGYPDSSYLNRLSEVLNSHGIDDQPVKS